eukprot:7391847-Prymnesium_polylepis.6
MRGPYCANTRSSNEQGAAPLGYQTPSWTMLDPVSPHRSQDEAAAEQSPADQGPRLAMQRSGWQLRSRTLLVLAPARHLFRVRPAPKRTVPQLPQTPCHPC